LVFPQDGQFIIPPISVAVKFQAYTIPPRSYKGGNSLRKEFLEEQI
jgi:hypothetical protein